MKDIVIIGSVIAIFALIYVVVRAISVSRKFRKRRTFLYGTCSSCGEKIFDQNPTTCPKCGKTFGFRSERTICPLCGSEIKGVLKKSCSKCGGVF